MTQGNKEYSECAERDNNYIFADSVCHWSGGGGGGVGGSGQLRNKATTDYIISGDICQ